jgi:hypothetical protein
MARRRAKDTTASKWRDLQESDMVQYMASSGSEDDNSGDDSDGSDDDIAVTGKKKKSHSAK